jgi:NAD(P)-dependent dehydrogenase (short-subunit alcohol dehydrogenase family)
MRISKYLRKCAKYILFQPKAKVMINLCNVDYHSLLNGKNIVITGGSRGIGKAIATKCLSEGANVIITGRNEDSLKKVCKEMGANCKYLVQDYLQTDDFSEFISSCKDIVNGEISAIVLNAGISLHEGNFLNVTFDNFSQQVDVNLKSNFFLAQEFIKYLLNNKAEGSLLFISSETAGKCNDLPYGLTKVAINSLVGGIARRVYQKGIRVNAIAPGVTFTDMTKGNHHIDDDYSNNSVAGRYFLPEEIAEVAVFVLSDVSKCITGEVLYCDAGSHLKINGTETEYSL